MPLLIAKTALYLALFVLRRYRKQQKKARKSQ